MNTRDNFKQFFWARLPHNYNIHDDTLNLLYAEFLQGLKPVTRPEFFILGGDNCLGKQTNRNMYADQENYHTNNPYDIMLKIPGYQASLESSGKTKAAEKWQSYAELLSNIMVEYAIQQKLNVNYDRSCGSQESLSAIKHAKLNGYSLQMYAFYSPQEINQEYIKFSSLWDQYLELLDKVYLYKSTDINHPIFLKENDKYSIYDHATYDDFVKRQKKKLNVPTSNDQKSVALITGASRGIGRALALELASRGIHVIAVARTESNLKLLEHQYPKNIQTITADITTESGRKKIYKKMQNTTINFLVHNAAVITPLGNTLETSEEKLRNSFETNLFAPILLTQKLNSLLKDNHCRILNISSVAGDSAVQGASAYCISKAALNMWTDALKLELQSRGILVARAIPGEVDTAMQGVLRDTPIEQFPLADEFKQARDKNTLIQPEKCAVFLANLLLETAAEEFSTKNWNIYTDFRGAALPQPYNNEKLGNSVVSANLSSSSSKIIQKPLPMIPAKKVSESRANNREQVKLSDNSFLNELSAATHQQAEKRNIVRPLPPIPPRIKK